MLNALSEELNWTNTENGALAYHDTGDACLNLFSTAGALREASAKRLKDMFLAAYAENPVYAMRILFYQRDTRGGLGERSVFRQLLQYAATIYPESVRKNLQWIPEYGRFDDCMVLLNTPCEPELIQLIQKQLQQDRQDMLEEKPISLLAKWLPSVHTSNQNVCRQAKLLCKRLHLSEKAYRKMLSQLRTYADVLEKRLCRKDYTFDYAKLPSRALYKYQKAFCKHDRQRYSEFLERAEQEKGLLKAGQLFPYEIVRDCIELEENAMFYDDIAQKQRILDVTWKSLPDYMPEQNAIAVVDGSGSMYWNYSGDVMPIHVAVSLGIYCAERNEGYFHNHFITFSDNPRLIALKGEDIFQKVEHCMSYNEVSNTNLEKVFRLILQSAVQHHVPPEELPKVIYVISDMEFDEQSGNGVTIFQQMKQAYQAAGYQLPAVVYWNVCSRNRQFPVKKDDTGAVLVSGCSPFTFQSAVCMTTPEKYMQQVLEGERYCRISA